MSNLYLGLMSGTSLDGVDIALLDFSEAPLKCRQFETYPYPGDLMDSLHELNLSPSLSLHELCRIESELGKLYSESINHFLRLNHLAPSQITAIGSHGQTIFHAPEVQMSLQVGHPAFIAKGTQITTVADFRIDDMANGGQGAPLAPAFHKYLFGSEKAIGVVNIGGIANLTIINKDKTIGFDTGPGNGLMDEVCRRFFNLPFDQSGKIAGSHLPNHELLEQLLTEPYFSQPFPKSSGRDLFNFDWLDPFIKDENPETLIATLNLLTARTIVDALQKNTQIEHLIVSGGGAENLTLLNHLRNHLDCPVSTTQDLGYDPQSIEAMMMGWLAKLRLENKPVQLSQITGAVKDSVIGAIWHP